MKPARRLVYKSKLILVIKKKDIGKYFPKRERKKARITIIIYFKNYWKGEKVQFSVSSVFNIKYIMLMFNPLTSKIKVEAREPREEDETCNRRVLSKPDSRHVAVVIPELPEDVLMQILARLPSQFIDAVQVCL